MLTKTPIFKLLSLKLKSNKRSIIKLLGISMISSGLVVLQPLLMQKLIDEALIPKDQHALLIMVSLIVVAGLCSMLLSALNQYQYTKLSTKILFAFKTDIFERLFIHNKSFFQSYQTGDILSRLEGDVSEIQRFGTDSIFALSTASLGMIGALIMVFSFDPLLALLAMILLPFEFMMLKPLYPKMTATTHKVRESGSNIASFMIESIRYMLFFKRFNAQEHRVKALRDKQQAHTENILSQQRIQILFAQIPSLISLLGRITILLYVGDQIMKGQMQVGELIACITYFGMILGPIQTYLGILNAWPKVKVSLKRLEQIMPKAKPLQQSFSSKRPNISFVDLGFCYENRILYKNVDLNIAYGSKVLLQGENGAGKSTLFDLLLQAQDGYKGKIFIDKKELQTISTDSLYELIGCVEQTPIVLAGSLRENLLLAKKDASEASLLQALKQVGLSSWLKSLPKGLDTILSEEGSSLSGGQKQRLSIARVLLQDPAIVLLDEHTASLDEQFKAELDLLLDELFAHKTRIIISHQSSYKQAKVYKIEQQTFKEVL